MKFYVLLLVLLFGQVGFAQNKLDWEENINLKLPDFQSTASKIDAEMKTYACMASLRIDFFYNMSPIKFMFVKEFNSEVTATFQKSASYVQAPDSAVARYLLDYSNYAFDLTELYARRFRKELFETKKFFSNTNFHVPIYNKYLTELNQKMAEVSAKSQLGKIKSTLTIEHQKVQEELLLLKDFCKSCIPIKE